jgi:hypothetical protein
MEIGELLNLAPLLDAGLTGLLVIVLALGWYERREMRKQQFELVKLLIFIEPTALTVLSPALQRQVKRIELDTKQRP